MAELTEEQAAVYDRQIRVWGADVQKRLSNAMVLVLGCTPLAAETCKNFVLAGVGTVKLMDDTPVSAAAPTFLIRHGEDPATSTSQAFAATLQDMNPMVSVSAVPGAPAQLENADAVKGFELVLLFGQHAGCQARVNKLCRSQGVKFISAVSRGAITYAFADLVKHSFKEKAGAEGNALPTETLEFVPLELAAHTPWSKLPTRRMFHGFLAVYTVIAAFEIREGRFANPADLDGLMARGHQLVAECGCKEQFWSKDLLELYLGFPQEFPPVNAVMGGLIANDVIRCLSCVGRPFTNLLLYSLHDNSSQVHNLAG